MGEKLVVGPFNRGFRNDRTAVVVDNDNFPTLINAYQWRGRVKRKRGTSKLNRLTRYFDSTVISYNSGPTTITLNGSGEGNILTGFSLQANGNLVLGSVEITDTATLIVYTDPSMDGTLSPSGTINYATGDITIAAAAGNAVSVVFLYFPDLPVMGLETFDSPISQFPFTIAFDTTYSYNIQTAQPYGIYDVSFYKNPPVDATNLPLYVPKTDLTPTTWNGQDYQQFWTVNYQGAMWATNGMNVPFATANIGMQYVGPPDLTAATWVSPTEMDFTTAGNNLVVGDFVFTNEFTTAAPADAKTLNFQTGYVTVAGAVFRVKFPFANITNTVFTPGIVQFLTNRSDITKDCIRWYDGDPTNGSATAPILTGDFGWVNFCPPLSQDIFSIADLPPRQYYLVGAKMIIPFKDRLLFIGPVVQSSTPDSQVYLQDTVIYSQSGTPYYTVSFDGSLAIPTFHSVLLPINQTGTQSAYWEDQTGFGGFITAGVSQPINTASANEDALILGFSYLQTRFIYTGNDIVPFNFFLINSELGSSSTFSAINLDQGVMTRGNRGFVMTSQTSTQRFDLEIPDQVFQNQLTSNGTERVTAQRDFIHEWIYFTYPRNNPTTPEDTAIYKFPNQTMFYNYRDQSWGLFNEAYTHYGQFQRRTGYTWATIGDVYPQWREWNDPWDSGSSTLLQPEIIAGNQQGYVVFRADGTGETESLYVQSFSTNTVVSPDHSLDEDDYITFSGVLGTVGTQVNGKIFSVTIIDENSFILDPPIVAGTYFGGGEITRMYLPYIQTKQFPTFWNMARKTRIGNQAYLLTRTPNSQIQLLIFLSQNATFAYNEGPIIPSQFPQNSSLVYSTVLYTCPESTNLGLTPANSNLQTPTADSQAQIWHRINTSLIGDTVQLGFTMSDAQMRDEDFTNQFEEIELHGFTLDITPSQLLV